MKTNKEVVKLTQKHVAQTYRRFPIALVRGKGTKVWDASGNSYTDFVAGLAADNLGHCHPNLVKAIRTQAGRLLHVSNLYHIEPQSELAQELTQCSFADKVFFCNSGTEANESAIKLARRFFHDQGEKGRYEIIAMKNSFHGRTMGSLSATGQDKFHTGFKPLLPGFKFIPFNNIRAAEKAVSSKTCAILVEPVQGEGGVNLGDKNYFKGLKRICKANNILLIFDEVQTAFGRTGTLFAYERLGIKPDIITLAKALGGGVAIGAMAASNRLMKSLIPGTHAATFGGNPLACAAGLASVRTIKKTAFLKQCQEKGKYFYSRLKGLRFSVIKEVRGVGLMLAIELNKPGAEVVLDCMRQGFLINCIQQNILRFTPPLIITKKEIDNLIKALSISLEKL
ncbi:MAG: aspartate aminotransferase family protein [Nitrospinota bacterium]|nr:aspartate aminotransferase family protein [Nitrospinota bacterium]